MMADKKADLAGPGISTYEEVDKILPHHYEALLGPKERMKALSGFSAGCRRENMVGYL
jgi:aspartate--ammonia ligase